MGGKQYHMGAPRKMVSFRKKYRGIGASGQNGKKYKLKRKKSFLYRRIMGQRGATENVVATCPDAPIIPRKV